MVKAEAQQSINRQLNVVLNWGEELMLHRRPLASFDFFRRHYVAP